jgi:hypothetical protein
MGSVRIPIKASVRESLKHAGYIYGDLCITRTISIARHSRSNLTPEQKSYRCWRSGCAPLLVYERQMMILTLLPMYSQAPIPDLAD